MAIIIIIIPFIVLFAVVYLVLVKRPKTSLEKSMDNLKKAEKITRRNKKKLDEAGQNLDTFTKELIKKNDEMLKEIQRKQN